MMAWNGRTEELLEEIVGRWKCNYFAELVGENYGMG